MPAPLNPYAKTVVHPELVKLAPDAIIELFVLDLSPITGDTITGPRFYFHAGTNHLTTEVIWQGQAYAPVPVEVEGFEYTIQGALPRPKLRMSNAVKLASALILHYRDLVGAKLYRKRTFARFLDGLPDADPNIYLPDELWIVDRKARESRLVVEWELSSPLDTEGAMLPFRVMIANSCSWAYRGDGCGYGATKYYTLNNEETLLESEDRCNHKLSGCKQRFGQESHLPFGGFPGIKRYG